MGRAGEPTEGTRGTDDSPEDLQVMWTGRGGEECGDRGDKDDRNRW